MHTAADQIVIIVHEEEGTYWAEIEGIPGFSAADNTLPHLLYRIGNVMAHLGVGI